MSNRSFAVPNETVPTPPSTFPLSKVQIARFFNHVIGWISKNLLKEPAPSLNASIRTEIGWKGRVPSPSANRGNRPPNRPRLFTWPATNLALNNCFSQTARETSRSARLLKKTRPATGNVAVATKRNFDQKCEFERGAFWSASGSEVNFSKFQFSSPSWKNFPLIWLL